MMHAAAGLERIVTEQMMTKTPLVCARLTARASEFTSSRLYPT